MANNPKHMDNLKGRDFASNPQNIHKGGRPKKIYTILKELGYFPDDIRTAFGELAWHEYSKLQEIAKDKTKPIIIQIVAGQFISAKDNNNWNKIKEILEHVIGKPKQTIEATVGTQKADLAGIFPKDDELEDDELNNDNSQE